MGGGGFHHESGLVSAMQIGSILEAVCYSIEKRHTFGVMSEREQRRGVRAGLSL